MVNKIDQPFVQNQINIQYTDSERNQINVLAENCLRNSSEAIIEGQHLILKEKEITYDFLEEMNELELEDIDICEELKNADEIEFCDELHPQIQNNENVSLKTQNSKARRKKAKVKAQKANKKIKSKIDLLYTGDIKTFLDQSNQIAKTFVAASNPSNNLMSAYLITLANAIESRFGLNEDSIPFMDHFFETFSKIQPKMDPSSDLNQVIRSFLNFWIFQLQTSSIDYEKLHGFLNHLFNPQSPNLHPLYLVEIFDFINSSKISAPILSTIKEVQFFSAIINLFEADASKHSAFSSQLLELFYHEYVNGNKDTKIELECQSYDVLDIANKALPTLNTGSLQLLKKITNNKVFLSLNPQTQYELNILLSLHNLNSTYNIIFTDTLRTSERIQIEFSLIKKILSFKEQTSAYLAINLFTRSFRTLLAHPNLINELYNDAEKIFNELISVCMDLFDKDIFINHVSGEYLDDMNFLKKYNIHKHIYFLGYMISSFALDNNKLSCLPETSREFLFSMIEKLSLSLDNTILSNSKNNAKFQIIRKEIELFKQCTHLFKLTHATYPERQQLIREFKNFVVEARASFNAELEKCNYDKTDNIIVYRHLGGILKKMIICLKDLDRKSPNQNLLIDFLKSLPKNVSSHRILKDYIDSGKKGTKIDLAY